MRLIIGPRASGKTTELIDWMLAGLPKGLERWIVVSHMASVEYYRNKVVERTNDPLKARVLAASEAAAFLRSRKWGSIEIAVDDIDEVLSQLLRWPIKIASLTPEDVTALMEPGTTPS